jgi:hypothetical protein
LGELGFNPLAGTPYDARERQVVQAEAAAQTTDLNLEIVVTGSRNSRCGEAAPADEQDLFAIDSGLAQGVCDRNGWVDVTPGSGSG